MHARYVVQDSLPDDEILSPFLVHTTFAVHLQTVNNSGYGSLGHHQYSLE